ncbi:MAG: 4'-phosphopantetheinyl transferase superfamily protein [Terracidiphilus sp.]
MRQDLPRIAIVNRDEAAMRLIFNESAVAGRQRCMEEALGVGNSTRIAEDLVRSGGRDLTRVYWLGQTKDDLPSVTDWLSPAEARQLERFRFEKRRADWLLGRRTAKHAVALSFGIDPSPAELARIEIRAAPSGAPEVILAGWRGEQPQDVTISLSHSYGRAICTVVPGKVALGCDIERIESRSDEFIADYFTIEEQRAVAACAAPARARISTLIWSAKESALKALLTGLRLNTRSVSVDAPNGSMASSAWSSLQVCYQEQTFNGWWLEDGDFVITVVSDLVKAGQPMQLEPTGHW